jgi:hypothetical protein
MIEQVVRVLVSLQNLNLVMAGAKAVLGIARCADQIHSLGPETAEHLLEFPY